MKRTNKLILVAILIMALTITASASQINTYKDVNMSNRYTTLTSVFCNAGVNSSGIASCYGDANARPGYYASIMLTLYQDSDSNPVTSWNATGSVGGDAHISETVPVSSGHYYYVKLFVSSYNTNNILIESDGIASTPVYY